MQDHYLLWKTEIKKYNISCFRNIIFPIRTKHARIFLIKFNPSTIRSAFAIFICRVFGHLTNLMKGHVHLIFTCPKQTTSCQIFKVKLKSIILSLTEGQSGWIRCLSAVNVPVKGHNASMTSQLGIFYKFLYDGKPVKIKRNDIINYLWRRGLKLPYSIFRWH